MPLTPYLEQLLTTYDPERLLALLSWIEPAFVLENAPHLTLVPANPAPMPDAVAPVAAPLQDKDPSTMTMTTLEPPALEAFSGSDASLNDLILFSILDEFGPAFMNKACVNWLSQCVSARFSTQNPQIG